MRLRIVIRYVAVSIIMFFGSVSLAAAENLLLNAGCENGAAQPESWQPVSPSPSPSGITFLWDDTVSYSGKRSLALKGSGSGSGMWRQTVPVVSDQVYMLTGYVAFEGINPGQCRLQLVFLDASDVALQTVNFPNHRGTRGFNLDFPAKLKVRAPQGATTAEVNCFFEGTGQAWFDDLFFGLAPLGRITGTVTSEGLPVQGARVFIWGDPWDKVSTALTDMNGEYVLENVPVSFPRYVLLAEAEGYRTQARGRVGVIKGGSVTVNFDLPVGNNPEDDLRVKFGTLGTIIFDRPPAIPLGAVIPEDATGYPASIMPYLEADEYIQSDHPVIRERAQKILKSVDPAMRQDTRSVAWAVYAWVAMNIEHDGIFFNPSEGGMQQPFRDVTSGIWQSISDEGWCFGKNIYDWAYRPAELIGVGSGVCIEHAWLVAALLRALNIPSRASLGSLEFWAQDTLMNGVWMGVGPTGGRVSFRETGQLGEGFGTPVPAQSSVLSRPVLRADWNARYDGLWRETHPWEEDYESTAAGYAQAIADLDEFSDTGKAASYTYQPPGNKPPESIYKIYYSDVTINLYSMIDQTTLDVRFPLVTDTDSHTSTGDHAYWTNHPECVVSTWIEEIANPPIMETERWFYIKFDISSLINGSSDANSNNTRDDSRCVSPAILFHQEIFRPSVMKCNSIAE